MTDTFQKAKDTFKAGLFCAESVLKVIAGEEGFQSEFIHGMATGFCGGIVRTGNLCGAVAGGVLAINLVNSRKTAEESVEKTFVRCRS